MTKEEVLEKMEEEKESVKSKILYGQSSNSSANGCGWCFDVINHAIDLVEQLDEPKKVVIPQFVADWIEEYSGCCSRLEIVNQIILNKTFENDWWLNSGDNQELLLLAITNGYEVEKEPRYRVLIKGFKNYNEYYINYDCDDEIICLDDKYERNNFKTIFTKSWLKDNWPEYDAYNNAGLLEFVEVEDE